MRKAALALLVLGVPLLTGRAAHAGERDWVVQVGGGIERANDARLRGYSATVGVRTLARTRVQTGIGLAWFEFPPRSEAAGTVHYDVSRAIAVVLSARMQFLQGSDASPFALAEFGIGRLSLGERSDASGPGLRVPRLLMAPGAGFGMRIARLGQTTDLESTFRVSAWRTGHDSFESGSTEAVASLRLTCAW